MCSHHEYVVADAFTDTPLQGNPVAVFLDGTPFSATRMQQIAREMNLSETTFVLPPEGAGDVRVRIFTPVNELPFAGHPTLGTAIVLGAGTDRDMLRMETAVGVVPFALERVGGAVVSARMQQPVPSRELYGRADDLLAALDLTGSTMPVEVYRNGPRHVFVGLDDVEVLSALHPDHHALATHPDVAVNCVAGTGSHWRLRMFSPAYGVAEDAATGSAAGPLAVHLTRHGVLAAGQEVQIEQGVEIGRRSVMRARTEWDGTEVTRVDVCGCAVVVAHGVLEVAPDLADL